MILKLKDKQGLERAKQRFTSLGIEYLLHVGSEESFFEFNGEASVYHPAELLEKLNSFGTVLMSSSKTPHLDALSSSYAVKLTSSQKKEVSFHAGSGVWIAGPCALDESDFLHMTAEYLSKLGVSVLRGGAVKPRTSPHDFQGVGKEGYRWLADIAHQYGMLAISE